MTKMQGIINIDKELCIGCKRCAAICPVDAIEGKKGSPQMINRERCIMCGQCVQVCTAYASVLDENLALRGKKLQERNMLPSVKEPLFAAYYAGHAPTVKEVLANHNLLTMVQCAPAVRVAIAEEFDMPLGSLTPGKMAAILRELGFNRVYDTYFSTELTIMEESSELLERIIGGGLLPMFTSFCPAWVKFIEQDYPELISHLSSCKSPQQMAGTLYKTYGAEIDGVDAAKVYSVSVVPCTGKKFECERPEMRDSGYRDVDVVITTRELAQLIKDAGIDLKDLPEKEFDKPLRIYSGDGTIFSAAEDVMEVSLRTGYELLAKQEISDDNHKFVGGDEGVRKSEIKIGDRTIKVAVVAGLKNVVSILAAIKAGKADFHFVEVMACPGGCINGGGQPKIIMPDDEVIVYSNRTFTAEVQEQSIEYRNLHNRQEIQEIYEELLDEDVIQQLLHTKYNPRGWCEI
ncbi:[Fe-Fe] hydrogenase large subunit C-terminal domain-containing protein [Sporomusa sp. KB1]|jgi:iron-only hydrogenase group A|uniref:[Fe-Fe] hydrogenase large subunit C-terminal domain-containing protein n=1 Tax=Sporomusa sp. KB1 TaxID=943346 RepID=UPI0011A3C5F0|nr:[Fe-Fe] hydrogenase large subunit C-terminal domain-containing protein [Sporomusa sp. KB1]TWH46507.1 iron-only hydrogenase group A [Sporomusa sp. KB1]